MRCMGFDEVDVGSLRWRLCRCGTRAVHRLFLSFDGSILYLCYRIAVFMMVLWMEFRDGAKERELSSKSILLYEEKHSMIRRSGRRVRERSRGMKDPIIRHDTASHMQSVASRPQLQAC